MRLVPSSALQRSYKMEIIKDTNGKDLVFITNEDGSTLSMLKSTYDEQQAALSTPMVIDDPKS